MPLPETTDAALEDHLRALTARLRQTRNDPLAEAARDVLAAHSAYVTALERLHALVLAHAKIA